MQIIGDDMKIEDDDDLRVITETPRNRPQEDSPNLGLGPSNSRGRFSYADFVSGHPPSIGSSLGQSSSAGRFQQHPTASPSEITDALQLRINNLFPDTQSYLDEDSIRGQFWNKYPESEFQELWKRESQDSRFVQGPRGDSDELELWKMILIYYRTILPHLFTYGLRLGPDCYEAPGSIMLSSEASYKLQKICAHPIWGREFDTLRFVLQVAVKLSMGLRWIENKLDDRPELWGLIKQLGEHVMPAVTDEAFEPSLFILTIDVMDGVLRALEGYHKFWYFSPREYVERFRRYYGGSLVLIEPRDNRQLMDVKWELELQELRDEEIRKLARLSRKRERLYDIPHPSQKHSDKFPPSPFGKDMEILAIWAGIPIEVDPKRRTLQRLDSEDPVRARDLDLFSRSLEDRFYVRSDSPLSHRESETEGVADKPTGDGPAAPQAPEGTEIPRAIVEPDAPAAQKAPEGTEAPTAVAEPAALGARKASEQIQEKGDPDGDEIELEGSKLRIMRVRRR